jgi:hypothetical protein
MRIWIIGTDPVARALGRSWTQAGHQVLYRSAYGLRLRRHHCGFRSAQPAADDPGRIQAAAQ